ncbi:MAG TPA: acetate/propionate family kinase [Bryobacteraceae bacterium]|nr:acetate/propionate family kinase [Bryobacteraceae bacterium]
MNVLTLNAGSNSLKFDLIEASPAQATPMAGRRLTSGTVEDIGSHSELTRGERTDNVEATSYAQAAEHALSAIRDGGERVDLVAHRVVHGGSDFTTPVAIDNEVLAAIARWEEAAPLHNAPALEIIRHVQEALAVPGIAVFDTAFHSNIPPVAFTYALPWQMARELHIRRYGFHGISHRYQLLQYAALNDVPANKPRLVTLHLENGSSAAAIRDGHSIDTSMGFTPLEGLTMGTRCGDIDPAIVTYIARKRQMSLEDVERVLNRESGLLGLSGISNDTRVLSHRLDEERARLALEVFSYRVTKYVSAYLSVLGGADAVVFSGGIGENTPFVRGYVCERLRWCGLELDADRNVSVLKGDVRVSQSGSRVHAWVIHSDEALMLAHEAATHHASSQ